MLVRTVGDLPPLPGVEQISAHNGTYKLTLAPRTTPQDVLQALLAQSAAVERFEIAVPTLDEIFVRVVEEGDGR